MLWDTDAADLAKLQKIQKEAESEAVTGVGMDGSSSLGGGGSLGFDDSMSSMGELSVGTMGSMTSTLSNAEYFPCSASLNNGGALVTTSVERAAVDALVEYLIDTQTPDQQQRGVICLHEVEERLRFLRR